MLERKKVLYIITKSIWGGATKYTCDLASALPRDQFEVFAAAGPVPADYSGRDLFSELRDKGVTLFEIKNFQKSINPLKDIFAFFEIVRLIRAVRPDIVHVSSSKVGGLVSLAVFFLRLLKAKKLKAIFTAHGWAYHEDRPFWQKFFIKLASRATALFYDAVICVSEYDRRSALENHIAPAAKLITVHNGITNDNFFLSTSEAQESILPKVADKNFWIGTIGEFTANKGHKFLIKAAAQIVGRRKNVGFVIIGHHGQQQTALKEQVVELGLTKDVFIIEYPLDAAQFVDAFDIFVLPSLKEGLPYVLLEAGANGVPVVASNVGGIPEIVEDGKEGFLVPPGNAAALATVLEKMISDKYGRHGFSKALYKKIEQEFSFAKMLGETLKIYIQ